MVLKLAIEFLNIILTLDNISHKATAISNIKLVTVSVYICRNDYRFNRGSLCDSGGESYDTYASGDMPPENPENLSFWVDTGVTPYALKQYSKTEESWISVATPYVKIAAVGIGKAFMQYDGVTISGIVAPRAEGLNGSAVICARGDDFLVIAGILDCNTTQLM